jgi:hypothetical protein
MKPNNRHLKELYQQGIRPMGVFQIRNLVTEKVFVAAGINLAGTINRHRFQLGAGVHSSRALQLDWDAQGTAGFAFEILDQMNPATDLGDSRKDLEALLDLWLKKLKPYDEQGYNERKLDRGALLKQMASRRAESS